MSASRIKINNKPALKLNIHDFAQEDLPFLQSLGITEVEQEKKNWIYAHITSQKDFLATRQALLKRFTVVEEHGPKVFLRKK